MAKIILKDKSEYEVTNDTAKQLWAMKANPKNNDVQTKLGNVGTTIGSIGKVLFDEQKKSDPFDEKIKNLHNKRRAFLKLTPKEKAKEYSWGHFKFFYNGIYKKDPDEMMKTQVQEWAEEFYQNNPLIDRVIMELWYKRLNLPEKAPMTSIHHRYLRLQQDMAIRIMQEDADYESDRIGITVLAPKVVV